MIKFLVPLTRALIRDQHTRRQLMFYTVLVAMLMLFAGATFLQSFLREHVLLLLLYWAVCGWMTIAAMLLAVFDLLMVRMAGRIAQKQLEREYMEEEQQRGSLPKDQ